MLEYLWASYATICLARAFPIEHRLLYGVDDVHRFSCHEALTAHFTEGYSYATRHKYKNGGRPPLPPLPPSGVLRIEVAPFTPNHGTRAFPGDYVETKGATTWDRITFLLQALACTDDWRRTFAYFTVHEGSYTLYAHCA